MEQIAKRVEDKRLLKLIRAFLTAGVMENGLVSPSVEGTPQGGPLITVSTGISLARRRLRAQCLGSSRPQSFQSKTALLGFDATALVMLPFPVVGVTALLPEGVFKILFASTDVSL